MIGLVIIEAAALAISVNIGALALGQPLLGRVWWALLIVSGVSYVLGYVRAAAEYDPQSPFKDPPKG